MPSPESNGWVTSIGQARLFTVYPDFRPESIHPSIDVNNLAVHAKTIAVGRENIIKPTSRPKYYVKNSKERRRRKKERERIRKDAAEKPNID